MNAIPVRYHRKADRIEIGDPAAEESWADVCDRYHGDVQRVRDDHTRPPYSALYVCHDDDNNPSYFLVEEDTRLHRLRHRNLYQKLGRKV